MSSDSRSQREKLKEEYKQHYRKMRDAKKRAKQARRKHNIVEALKNMNSSELMESFDSFLFEVKSKVAHAEARLDVALDSLDKDTGSPLAQAENEEAFNQAKAKETLKQLKNEMGMLYSELEQQADAIDVDKTIGKKPSGDNESTSANKTNQ